MKTIYYIFFLIAISLAFVFGATLCSCKIVPTEAEIERRVNERVAAKLEEQGVKSSDTKTSTSNENAEPATNRNQYTFEFVVSGTINRISFDKQEETAQLYVKGDFAPEGKTFYGICQYDGLYRKGQIKISGFDGADKYDIHHNGEKLSWHWGVWIDYQNNYLYITHDAARAMNPDYRIELKPIN